MCCDDPLDVSTLSAHMCEVVGDGSVIFSFLYIVAGGRDAVPRAAGGALDSLIICVLYTCACFAAGDGSGTYAPEPDLWLEPLGLPAAAIISIRGDVDFALVGPSTGQPSS